MAPNQTSRELTADEKRALKLLRKLEDACDKKKNGIPLGITHDAMYLLIKHKLLTDERVRKAKYDGKACQYSLTMTLTEYYKYVMYCCSMVGLTVNIDGSVTTKDKLTLTSAEVH